MGDLTADDDARTHVQPAVYRLRQLAADVVEVDVDALVGEGVGDLSVLVVDCDVVAVQSFQLPRLRWPAGDTDGSATCKPGQLTGDLADRTGGCGNHDRVPGPRPADIEQAEVRGHPGRTDCVQREGWRLERRRNEAH